MHDQAYDPSQPPSKGLTKTEARKQARAVKEAKRTGGSGYHPLQAKTARQAEYIKVLAAGGGAFAVGGAGTGKTYIPARMAARRLNEGHVDKIIIARVTASDPRHCLGFLPGKLDAKMKPWLLPVLDGIKAEVSGQMLAQWEQDGKVEFASFEHMRGRTFKDCVVILDEAQNATFSDLRLFLTRIGENCQVVVTGDMDQIDISNSGLNQVLDLCDDYDIDMDIIEFDDGDVVRSSLARAWVGAFKHG